MTTTKTASHRWLGRAALALASTLALSLRALPAAAQASGEERTLVTSVTREIDVSVGENVTLSAARVRGFSEASNGKIADVRLTPSGDRFLITGREPGTTMLLLIKHDSSQEQISINVFPRPMRDVEASCSTLAVGFFTSM